MFGFKKIYTDFDFWKLEKKCANSYVIKKTVQAADRVNFDRNFGIILERW